MGAGHETKKNTYLVLLVAVQLVLALIAAGLFMLVNSSVILLRWGLIVVGLVILVFLVLMMVGSAGILVTRYTGKPRGFLLTPMRMTVNLTFPVIELLVQVLRLDVMRLLGAFVEFHNELVRAQEVSVRASELLLLLPVCLQKADCPHKVTINPDNCKRCGGCQIGSLLDLRDEYGFHLVIATGGTQARRAVKRYKPKAILAVACERDLASGIKDVRNVPVIGIPNQRPNGPCYETRVDLDAIRKELAAILDAELRGKRSRQPVEAASQVTR